MEKYGFIYLWYDRKHKRYYIGSHWGTIDDGYICSSVWMKQGYNHRPNDFKRKILKSNIERSKLLDEEHRWLSFIKPEELGKRYYNLRQHKWGHWANDINKKLTIGQKISEKKKGKPGTKHTEESKSKIRKARLNQIIPKWKHTEESKQKMRKPKPPRTKEHTENLSNALKGKTPWNKGKLKDDDLIKEGIIDCI